MIDPLEKRGIPSLPVYIAILIIILFMAFSYVPGITLTPDAEYIEVPIQIVDRNNHGLGIEGAVVTLEIDGEFKSEKMTDENGKVQLDMMRGEQYKIRAEEEGCGETSKTYTPPIDRDPDEMKLTLECELLPGADEVLVNFEPEDVGHVEYTQYDYGIAGDTFECGSSTGGCIAAISMEDKYTYEFESENYISELRYSGSDLEEMEEAGVPVRMRHKHSSPPGGSVEITVKNEDTGEPAPGVDVELIHPDTETAYREGTTGDTTGMMGKVLFEELEVGEEFRVKVLAGPNSNHKTTEEIYEVTEDKRITVEVKTEFETTIEVIGENEGPLRGAIVKILDGNEIISKRITDNEGKITTQLPDRTYRAVASKPGYREDIIESIEGGETRTATLKKVSEEELTDIEIAINSNPELTEPGNRTIKPSTGDARVTLMRNSNTPVSDTKETGSSGRVLFRDKVDGNYCLLIEWEGQKYLCPSETNFEVSPPEEDNLWDIYLEPPRYPLEVNVTDEAGEPIPGSEIEVDWNRGEREYTKTGETNSLGIAEFDIIAGDEIDVTASKEIEGMPISISESVRMSQKRNLDFTLEMNPPDMSQVTVNVIDEDENPLEEAPIKLVNPDNTNITIQDTYREEYAEGTTDEEGIVSFDKLRVGEEFKIKAEASKSNLHAISEENYTVTETNKEINFTVRQGVNTTITVVDVDGEEQEGATVKIDGGETATQKTNEDGEVTIQLEREEEHTVTASKPYYHYTKDTITGGVSKTIEIERIPEDETESEEIWIYTDSGATPGNREIPLTNAIVTLTKDGEKLRDKETTDIEMVKFEGLERGSNYGLDIEWKGETYSESFTADQEPGKYLYVSPPPLNRLIARIVNEDMEPIEGVPITITWPHDEEVTGQEEVYERGPEYTRTGEITDGEIIGGWTPSFENIVDGDIVKVQAETDEGETYGIVKRVDEELTEVTIGEDKEEIDPNIRLKDIRKESTEEGVGFEDLSIAPRRYEAEFEIDLTGPEWKEVFFTLDKSPGIDMEPGEIDDWRGWEYSESPNGEQVKINITGNYEHKGSRRVFRLPFVISPGLGGEKETLDFKTEWLHSDVILSKADSQELEIAEGKGEHKHGFYVEKSLREREVGDQQSPSDWESPGRQRYDPEKDVEVRYRITRTEEESFEGNIRLDISELGKFTEINEPENAEIEDENIGREGGFIELKYDELEYLETTTIKARTTTDVARATIDVTGTAETLEEHTTDLSKITYLTGGNIPVRISSPKSVRELENTLTLEITRPDKGKMLEEKYLEQLIRDSKITGEGLTCEKIEFHDNAQIIGGMIRIELDENCHYEEPGKNIQVYLAGGDIDEDSSPFDIRIDESVKFPGDATLKTDDESEGCSIPLKDESFDDADEFEWETPQIIMNTDGAGIAENCDQDNPSGIEVPYMGDVEVSIKDVKIEESETYIDLDPENGLWFGPLDISGYENIGNTLKITIEARNRDEPEISRTKEININAKVEYLSLSDVTANLFYPDPIQKYPEEGIGTPECSNAHCNLDQLLAYSIQRSKRENQTLTNFPGRLVGRANISTIQIRDTIRSTEYFDGWQIKFGSMKEEEEIEEEIEESDRSNYIVIDDSELPRTGRNEIIVKNGTLGDTKYYYLEFRREDLGHPLQYHFPSRMRLHMPQQRYTEEEVDDRTSVKTKTVIYADETMKERDIADDYSDRIKETIEEAWNSETEIIMTNDIEEFGKYDHGIRIGICPASSYDEIDTLEGDAKENCENIYDRTGSVLRSAIFKELPIEGNKINIVATNEDALENLTHSFELAFGNGVAALQVINPRDPGKGHLVPAPKKINYYAWDEVDKSKAWIEEEGQRVIDAIKEKTAYEMNIRKEDVELELVPKLSNHSNVSWIIMRCEKDDIENCGPIADPLEPKPTISMGVKVFRETFGNMNIPEGGIYFTVGIEQMTGTNVILVGEDEGTMEVRELIKSYTDQVLIPPYE